MKLKRDNHQGKLMKPKTGSLKRAIKLINIQPSYRDKKRGERRSLYQLLTSSTKEGSSVMSPHALKA